MLEAKRHPSETFPVNPNTHNTHNAHNTHNTHTTHNTHNTRVRIDFQGLQT